jgi:hypothetical protein
MGRNVYVKNIRNGTQFLNNVKILALTKIMFTAEIIVFYAIPLINSTKVESFYVRRCATLGNITVQILLMKDAKLVQILKTGLEKFACARKTKFLTDNNVNQIVAVQNFFSKNSVIIVS